MSERSTREKIIDTAYDLFRRKGYDKTTINDICDACGITKTTFYYHLDSKENLIASYYKTVTQSLASRIFDVLAQENYWEQLVVCFETIVESSVKIGPDLDAQLFIMNLRKDEGTFDMNDDLTKMAVLLIERAQKVGQIRNQSPPEQLYYAFAHAFIGYELKWCIKKGGFDRKKHLRMSMENIFDVDTSLRSAWQDEYY